MEFKLKHAIISSVISLSIGLSSIAYGHYQDYLKSRTFFTYEYTQDGEIKVVGQVDHNALSSWFLAEVKKENNSHELVILDKEGANVLTGEMITKLHLIDDALVSLDENVIYVEPLFPYLEGFDQQELYNYYDVRRLLDMIIVNYEWHTNKVLSIKIN